MSGRAPGRYRVPGNWSVLAAEVFLWGLPLATAILATLAQAAVPGTVLYLALAAAWAWVVYRHLRRVIASGIWGARLEFTAALGHLRPGDVYLHRGAHLLFCRSSMRVMGIPVTVLTCVDGDQASDLSQAGEGVLAGTEFRVAPIVMQVLSVPVADRLVISGSGEPESVPQPPRPMRDRVRGYVTLQRMLQGGYLYAHAGELLELAAQIRAAVPLEGM